MCEHTLKCPAADAPDACRAHIVADHTEQGWVTLCNGVILFDDSLYLTPTGRVGTVPHLVA